MQRSVALGDREFVIGSGEVIQADVEIAGGSQFRVGRREHPQLGVGGR